MEREKHTLLKKGDLWIDPETMTPWTGITVSTFKGSSVIEEWIPVENGRVNGVWETFYPDSSPKSRRGFLQGVLHGIDEEFTNDGKPLRHSINEYGQRSGVSTHWEYYGDYWKNGRLIKNGKLKKKYSMLNGVLHGEYETFHESGQLTEKSKYRVGSKIGQSEYWEYWDNGNIRKRYSKVRGLFQGEYEEHFGGGDFKEKGSYSNGLKHGVWESYLEGSARTRGRDDALRERINWSQGKKHGPYEYYHWDGDLTRSGTYTDGVDPIAQAELDALDEKDEKLFGYMAAGFVVLLIFFTLSLLALGAG